MKKRLIVGCTFIIVCAVLIGWYCTDTEIDFTGNILANGKTETGYAVVQYKNYNSLFGFRKMNGTIEVYLENNNPEIAYELLGTVLKSDSVWFVSAMGYSEAENSYLPGTLYFDKDMKNIILLTDEMEFISANDSFCEQVKQLQGD